jgi:replicative DNA helicase
MESLTSRAERAVLGAMIGDPSLATRLAYLQPHDFASERNRYVFTAALRAASDPGITADRWHSAISTQAGPMVASQITRDFAGACPVVAHGSAYGALVVEASLYRQLTGHGGQLTSRAEALAEDARRIAAADGAGGPQLAKLASHMKQLGATLTSHAARINTVPGQPGGVPRQAPTQMPPGIGTASPDREDALLTALLQRHPESRQVLTFLPTAAFADPYRQELFRAIRSLHVAGKPVDPLTADWELARRGIPLVGGGESYATTLARAEADGESPVKIATILLAQLHRRTSRATAPATELFPRPTEAETLSPHHSAPYLRLLQPPAGSSAPNAGPGQRI